MENNTQPKVINTSTAVPNTNTTISNINNPISANSNNFINKLKNSITPKQQPKPIISTNDSITNNMNKYTYQRKIKSFYNENKKEIFISIAILIAVIVGIIITIILVNRNKETPEEKAIRLENETKVNNKINEYNTINDSFILSDEDYKSKEIVIDKIIAINLSNIKYKKKTNKGKLEFASLDDILQYEQLLQDINERDIIYKNALERVKFTIGEVGKALGDTVYSRDSQKRIERANDYYLEYGRSKSNLIIYKFLSTMGSTKTEKELSKAKDYFNLPSKNLTQLFDLTVDTINNIIALATLYGYQNSQIGAYDTTLNEIMN